MSSNRGLLSVYLRMHGRYHGQIVARLQQRMDGGIHYTNRFNRRWEFFAERVGPADVVLDLACGTGTILKKIAPRVSRGYGIERDATNIGFCKTDAPANVEFIQGDIFALDYGRFRKERGVTVVVLSHILEHIDDVPAFLRTLHVPRLLICVPSEEHAYADFVKSLGLPYRTDDTHFREYTRTELRDHLGTAGYRETFMGFNGEGEIICEAQLST